MPIPQVLFDAIDNISINRIVQNCRVVLQKKRNILEFDLLRRFSGAPAVFFGTQITRIVATSAIILATSAIILATSAIILGICADSFHLRLEGVPYSLFPILYSLFLSIFHFFSVFSKIMHAVRRIAIYVLLCAKFCATQIQSLLHHGFK